MCSDIELPEPCPACGGEGFWERPYDIDRTNGAVLTHSYMCERCDGTGEVWLIPQAVTLDDIEQINEESFA